MHLDPNLEVLCFSNLGEYFYNNILTIPFISARNQSYNQLLQELEQHSAKTLKLDVFDFENEDENMIANMNEKILFAMAPGIIRNPHFTELIYDDVDVSANMVYLLGALLMNNPQLKKFSFTYAEEDIYLDQQPGFSNLITLLSQVKTLQKLNLTVTLANSKALARLIEALQLGPLSSSSQLAALGLNFIFDEDLCDSVRNDIYYKKLFPVLINYKKLSKIRMNTILIPEDGQFIADLINNHPQLSHCAFQGIRFDKESLVLIYKAITRNAMIVKFKGINTYPNQTSIEEKICRRLENNNNYQKNKQHLIKNQLSFFYENLASASKKSCHTDVSIFTYRPI